MAHHEGLCQWIGEVSGRQAMVLAVFSYGMVKMRRGGMSRVAHFMAALQAKEVNTVRQWLREWCYDGPDRRGQKRQEGAVLRSFT